MKWMAGLLAGSAALSLGGCGSPAVAEKPDTDPYLAMNTLLVENACSNCHAADYARVGPSMVDIAALRGPSTPEAHEAMAQIIQNGTQGSWGPAIMPQQSQIDEGEADKLATAILALYKE